MKTCDMHESSYPETYFLKRKESLLGADQTIDKFLLKTLPHGEWNHLAHLKFAALVEFLFEENYYETISFFIQEFNQSIGLEKLTVGFHVTITKFWVEYIKKYLEKNSFKTQDEVLSEIERDQKNLAFDKIFSFYDKDELFSEKARMFFISPAIPITL